MEEKERKGTPGEWLRRVCGVMLVVAAIVLIVGVFVEPAWVEITGFALFIAASLLSVVRMIIIIRGSISRTSPEFRNAVVNIVVMALVFGLALFGLIYNCVNLI